MPNNEIYEAGNEYFIMCCSEINDINYGSLSNLEIRRSILDVMGNKWHYRERLSRTRKHGCHKNGWIMFYICPTGRWIAGEKNPITFLSGFINVQHWVFCQYCHQLVCHRIVITFISHLINWRASKIEYTSHMLAFSIHDFLLTGVDPGFSLLFFFFWGGGTKIICRHAHHERKARSPLTAGMPVFQAKAWIQALAIYFQAICFSFLCTNWAILDSFQAHSCFLTGNPVTVRGPGPT